MKIRILRKILGQKSLLSRSSNCLPASTNDPTQFFVFFQGIFFISSTEMNVLISLCVFYSTDSYEFGFYEEFQVEPHTYEEVL